MAESITAMPKPKPASRDTWLPLILAAAAFLLYSPSLFSDLVYDARLEITREGFVTSLANLPAVLSLQVLESQLILGDRPGHLLYLMGIAAMWGERPWGYHLCSNLLHAANVALLFVLMRRLVAIEWPDAAAHRPAAVRLALVAATLVFAVHPLSVETVAAVNYSSDLLVTLFTLLVLLGAIRFRPEDTRQAARIGVLGTLGAFAAVTCKESGLAVALILAVFWILYRRRDRLGPWLCFLGGALSVTTLFLVARFALASADLPRLPYLGGSLGSVFLIQPRLWAFMFVKLVWPTGLSADYTLENADGLSLAVASALLLMVLLLQAWLAARSRLGALGVALFWLGLATVSNFVPLHRIMADRFYYLPLAGVAMQLTALLMSMKSGSGLRITTTVLLASVVPLTLLTLAREPVFASDYTLWSDTLKVSPESSLAHCNLAECFAETGRADEAIAEAQRAIELSPNFASAYNNLGWGYALKEQIDAALPEFEKAVYLDPTMAEAHNNLSAAYLHFGRVDEALTQGEAALRIRPGFAEAHYNLGNAFLLKNRVVDALDQYQAALTINPHYAKAHSGLGLSLFRQGHTDEAIEQFRESLAINPENANIHNDLGVALFQQGRKTEAENEFVAALQLAPELADARSNLAKVRAQPPTPARNSP